MYCYGERKRSESQAKSCNARGSATSSLLSSSLPLPVRLQLVYVFVPGLGRDAKWPAKLLLAPGAIYSLRLCKDSEGSSALKRVLASQLVRESASITYFRNQFSAIITRYI